MRPSPSAAFTAAINTAGSGPSRPDVRLEIIDSRQHYTQLGSTTLAYRGRNAAVFAADNGLVQAFVTAGGSASVRRITSASLLTGSSYSAAYTLISATAFSFAGVALAVLTDRIRLYYQDSGTFKLRYADSLDNGASWSAAADLFDPAAPVRGLAGDSGVSVAAALLFYAYDVAGPAQRVAVLSGGVKTDWTNGDFNQITGIAAVRNADGSQSVLAPIQGAAGGPYGIYTTARAAGGSWSALSQIQGVQTDLGVSLVYPHLAAFDGLSNATYTVADTGAYTGTPGSYVARCQSPDFIHWTEGLQDGHTFGYGACWLKHASAGYFLVSGDTCLRAPLYDAAQLANYRDCTADLLRFERVQRDGHPARLVLTLDNSQCTYALGAGLSPLSRYTSVRLSEGYVLPGANPGDAGNLLYTGVFYVDSWTYGRRADTNEVTIVARDLGRRLDRRVRDLLAYTNRTVSYLASETAARAGAPTVLVPASTPQAQFAEVIALYQLVSGETYLHGMDRLGALMGFRWAAVALNVGSPLAAGGTATSAQAGTDQLVLIEKAPSDASVWSYQTEPELFHLEQSDDVANHVIAYGQIPATTPGSSPATATLGEAWDFGNLTAVGEERFLHIVDRMLSTAAQAGKRATLELQKEQRASVAGSLVVPGNPLLELWDVLTVTDAKVAASPLLLRISGLHQHYDRRKAINDLVLTLEGQ